MKQMTLRFTNEVFDALMRSALQSGLSPTAYARYLLCGALPVRRVLPGPVSAAVNNQIALYLEARCDRTPDRDERVPRTEMYSDYLLWCSCRRESSLSRQKFTSAMVSAGIQVFRIKGYRYWGHIQLKPVGIEQKCDLDSL